MSSSSGTFVNITNKYSRIDFFLFLIQWRNLQHIKTSGNFEANEEGIQESLVVTKSNYLSTVQNFIGNPHISCFISLINMMIYFGYRLLNPYWNRIVVRCFRNDAFFVFMYFQCKLVLINKPCCLHKHLTKQRQITVVLTFSYRTMLCGKLKRISPTLHTAHKHTPILLGCLAKKLQINDLKWPLLNIWCIGFFFYKYDTFIVYGFWIFITLEMFRWRWHNQLRTSKMPLKEVIQVSLKFECWDECL